MNNGTILLVEDSEDDAELTVLGFKKANILNPVAVVEDGAMALDYLFKDPAAALPTLIILDLNLPKVPGLQVLQRIRSDARTRLLPVVVLTTSLADEDILNSYSLGANAYVRKPVAFDEFLGAAAKLGLFWLLTNVQPPNFDTRASTGH